MNLNRYFKIALRWWWLIFISVALSATASYAYSKRLPKIYAAKATVVVGGSITESLNPDQRSLQLSRTLAEVYSELAKRNQITQGIIDRHPELQGSLTAGQLGGMINTAVIQSAQLLEIFVNDGDPQRATFLANAVAEELILQSPAAQQDQSRKLFIQSQLDELETKIAREDERIREAQRILDQSDSAIERSQGRQDITDAETQKGLYQNTYSNLLANMSESSINRIEIFERATMGFLVGPNVQRNVIMAAIAGFALAITGIILLEFLDDTLVWNESMTHVAELPILGVVGRIANEKEKIIEHDKLWSPESSALRDLRDSILLTTESKTLNTMLITSPAPGEGKSFVSINLGVTFASPSSNIDTVGMSVILIDADLRKPSLHEAFDMPNLLGLSDVLIAPEGATDTVLKQAIRPTYIENLLVLPAGRTLVDPGSLLNSPRFEKVVRYLQRRAKLVIIDSAPILEAVETKAIDNLVDSTILVISSGRTRKKILEMATDYFHNKQKEGLLGVVFNRVRLPYGLDYYSHQAGAAQVEQMENSFFGKIMQPFSQNRRSGSGTLTLAEAAIELGVKKETVRRWCEEGRLPGIKTGSRWRVRTEDVEEYITLYKLSNTNIEEKLTVKEKSKQTSSNGAASPKELVSGEETPKSEVERSY